MTCGAEGALIYDGESLLKIASYPVNAIDTNGAGDMFAGAFLYALTHGYSYQQAGDFASRASAKVVAQYGPRLRSDQYQELKRKFFGAE